MKLRWFFFANPFGFFPLFYAKTFTHIEKKISEFILQMYYTSFFTFWRVYVQCIGRECVNAVSIASKVATAATNEDVSLN